MRGYMHSKTKSKPTKLAIIGGSGGNGLKLTNPEIIKITTPWGEPSAAITKGQHQSGCELSFMPRHGNPHTIPPHKINYRANLWALKSLEITDIIAINAVGGITEKMTPLQIVIPDQIIDYTWGRHVTFFEDTQIKHIDFSYPYSTKLRQWLIEADTIIDRATYGVTQGPRLETAAEIKRMEQDGCDIVGMTGMPEATFARELEMDYACCALVVNWAAGQSNEALSEENIYRQLQEGIGKVFKLLDCVIAKNYL